MKTSDKFLLEDYSKSSNKLSDEKSLFVNLEEAVENWDYFQNDENEILRQKIFFKQRVLMKFLRVVLQNTHKNNKSNIFQIYWQNLMQRTIEIIDELKK